MQRGGHFGVNRGVGGASGRSTAGQRIIARTAIKQVVAAAAIKAVVVGIAVNGIGTAAGVDHIIAGAAINHVIAKAGHNRVMARARLHIIGLTGGARIASGIIGIDAIAIGVADIAAVDQVSARAAIDNAVAQKHSARFGLQRKHARRVIGVKIVAGIGCQKRRVARAFQQDLAGCAVGHASGGLPGVAICKADIVVDIVNAEIAAAQIGQHKLKAKRSAAAIGRDVQPCDSDFAGAGIQIPINIAALRDIDIGPERRKAGLAQRGQRAGGIAGIGRGKRDQAVGVDVNRRVAGAVNINTATAEHARDVDKL